MTGEALGGVALAVAAACCYDTGYAFQALEAKRAPLSLALRPRLLAHLASRPRWVLASLVLAAGWPLQVGALRLAPLTVVQPLLSLGLVLLLVYAVQLLHEPVGARELGGVAAIAVGTGVIAAVAPDRSGHHAGDGRLATALVPLAAVVALPYLLRGLSSPVLLIVSAGAADAWAAVATKLVSDDLWGLPALGWALGAGAMFGFGVLSEMSALRTLAASRVGPTVLALQVVVPVLLAPAALGESWSGTALSGGAIVLALGVVSVGIALLARPAAQVTA